MAFKRIKGTTDYYPEEKSTQNSIFGSFCTTANNYGFSQVEAPAIETMELLTAKSGDEIRKQIFTCEKKGKEDIGLRFEFTASVARMFVEQQKALQKPVRWFSIDRVWRYERPQAGRDREFYQFNAEIYGSPNPESDAEVINLAVDSLRSLGLTAKDIVVRINNRELLQGLLLEIVTEDKLDQVVRIIDKRSKITKKEFEEELSFVGKDGIKRIEHLLSLDWAGLKKIDMNDIARRGYENLGEIMRLLDQDFIEFDISIARGLDYYTGTVFEIFDRKGKFRALCGGGRYDRMIELFGGQPTPATGYGMGYSTVSMLLKDKGLLPKIDLAPEYFVVVIDESVREAAMDVASRLRKKSIVTLDLMRRSFAKQLKYANSLGAKNVVFVGSEEVSRKKVKVKDMNTGKETEKEIAKL